VIQLTDTHIKILERQAQGWPEDGIRRFAGLHRDSDWLGTMQIINAWKMQEAERQTPPALATLIETRAAQAYRYLVESKKPRLLAEIAMHLGCNRDDARNSCRRLEKMGLVKSKYRLGTNCKEWVAV